MVKLIKSKEKELIEESLNSNNPLIRLGIDILLKRKNLMDKLS